MFPISSIPLEIIKARRLWIFQDKTLWFFHKRLNLLPEFLYGISDLRNWDVSACNCAYFGNHCCTVWQKLSRHSLFKAKFFAEIRVDASYCVPGIVTSAPWQLCTHGHEEIEDGPSQNDDVVNIHPAWHYGGSVANTWSKVISTPCSKMKYVMLPLNIGAILNTPRPPIVSICPSASSMKNMGIPARISVMKYGIRKAPPPFL